MKRSVKSVVVLVCICAVVSVLLAMTNYITEPLIKENEQKSVNAALLEVLPGGGSFTEVDLSGYTLANTVTAVYKAESGGYVVKLETVGYASGMVLMCGISDDGKVVGTKIISSGETPSIGGTAAETFADWVKGKDANGIEGVDTVAGATKTTAAYRQAIKDALDTVKVIGGDTAKPSASAASFGTEASVNISKEGSVL